MKKNSDGVGDRLVMHFTGFEPVPAKLHYIRLRRECRKFRKLWDIQQKFDPLNDANGASSWQVKTQGADWSTSTRIVLMEWCSFLDYPSNQTFWRRTFASVPHYFAHYSTLAPFNYFKANWRYGLAFICPVIGILAIAAVSWAMVFIMSQLVENLPVFLLVLSGLAIFIAILRFLGERWGLPLGLEFFHHAYSITIPDSEVFHSRVAIFSAIIREEIKASSCEEINITTHSIGSVYAVSALANALRKNPDLLDGKTLYFTTIASSVLHIALMDRCKWVLDNLELVLKHSNVQWINIYATNDPLCFNKCSPASVINGKPANEVISRRVRFSRMVDKKRYRLLRYNFFLLHRQMILSTYYRYFYDFNLILFGPRNVVDMLQRKPASEI